jgi:hypothetical protein
MKHPALICGHTSTLADVEALNRLQCGTEPVWLDVGGVRLHVSATTGAFFLPCPDWFDICIG